MVNLKIELHLVLSKQTMLALVTRRGAVMRPTWSVIHVYEFLKTRRPYEFMHGPLKLRLEKPSIDDCEGAVACLVYPGGGRHSIFTGDLADKLISL